MLQRTVSEPAHFIVHYGRRMTFQCYVYEIRQKIIQISNFLFGIFSWRVRRIGVETESHYCLYNVWNCVFFKTKLRLSVTKDFFRRPVHNLEISRTSNVKKRPLSTRTSPFDFFIGFVSGRFFRRQSWQRLIRSVGMTALRRFVDSTRRTFTTATFTIKQFTMMFLYVLPIILEWKCGERTRATLNNVHVRADLQIWNTNFGIEFA